MRRCWCSLLTVGLVIGLCAVPGCRPEIPEKELGTVLDHVPDLTGMDKPYVLRYVPPRPDAGPMGKRPPLPSTGAGVPKDGEAAKDAATEKENAKDVAGKKEDVAGKKEQAKDAAVKTKDAAAKKGQAKDAATKK